MIPRLTSAVKRISSTFFAYRNDIDIYTEDKGDSKEFYKVLFKRLLGDKVIINDITPLGTKREVLEQCSTSTTNKRKEIFIVDGDIDLITGNIPSMDNLYVLDSYCIENMIIDKNSVEKYIYLNCGVKSEEEISNSLDYDLWLNIYAELSMKLFFHFAILRSLSKAFILGSSHRFFTKKKFDKQKIEKEINDIKNEILTYVDNEYYTNAFNNLESIWPYNSTNFTKIVSGKDYIIPILSYKLLEYKKSAMLPGIEEIKLNLAHHCNLDRLEPLREEVSRICNS